MAEGRKGHLGALGPNRSQGGGQQIQTERHSAEQFAWTLQQCPCHQREVRVWSNVSRLKKMRASQQVHVMQDLDWIPSPKSKQNRRPNSNGFSWGKRGNQNMN